jgi:sugar phosphate isomerase/epimerase
VNAASSGEWEEQMKLAADGLSHLSELAEGYELNVIVENHGGNSSNGQWLSGVMDMVNMENCGTLPDFGNWKLGDGKTYDPYQGMMDLMPYAKSVSAKSYNFDEEGNHVEMDYRRILQIVKDAGYQGYIGIEYEGRELSEFDGILATKALLEKVRAELA